MWWFATGGWTCVSTVREPVAPRVRPRCGAVGCTIRVIQPTRVHYPLDWSGLPGFCAEDRGVPGQVPGSWIRHEGVWD